MGWRYDRFKRDLQDTQPSRWISYVALVMLSAVTGVLIYFAFQIR